MSGAPTISMAELTALGMTVRDGKAIRVGSGDTAELKPGRQDSDGVTTGGAQASPVAATVPPYRFKSKTEARYADRLDALKRCGEILNWRYECITLRLGDDVRYTPDFRVEDTEGRVALHEVKGKYVRDKGRIKLQAAATQFPEYRFVMAIYSKGNWTLTPVRAA